MKNKLEFIRPGSSKDIYRCDKDTIGFEFNNWYSVFDVGRAPDQIPGKGKAICACAVKSFEIAKRLGIPTCFVEQLNDTMIRVRETRIITDRALTLTDENYLVPIEMIYRLVVAGSFERAFKSGEKKPEDYGLPSGTIPGFGVLFPNPIRHITTKFEAVDRDLKIAEICQMAGITEKDLDEYWLMVVSLALAIKEDMKRAEFNVADGKMELVMGPGRVKSIGDVFGTQDEDRPYRIENGKVEHYSKEFIRQLHIESGYYAALKEARKNKLADIPIPSLAEEQLAEVSRRYKLVAELYGGVKVA